MVEGERGQGGQGVQAGGGQVVQPVPGEEEDVQVHQRPAYR